MAIDKGRWSLLHSTLLLLVSAVGEIEAQSCGGTYTADYGVFMSPNYPNVYDLNLECTYMISLPTVSSISLIFETFELDRSDGDFVSITCASNSSFEERKYVWGDKILPVSVPWCSAGQLHFHSDPYQNFTTRGFRVQYQVSTKDCGDTIPYLYSSNISSPNYPQNYNNNENCTYAIGGHESSTFTLNFQTFDLESDCQRDWVQIRCDNSSYISPKYCGSTLPKSAYITNCRTVLIWFHTDNSNVFSGFSLQFSWKPNGCGTQSYAALSSGILTSQNYPIGYVGYNCVYLIYPVSSIAIAFQSFDLEPFIDMSHGDSMQIECHSDPDDVAHYFRGNTLPPLISYTLCSSVFIVFHSDWVISGTGFSMRYHVNPLVTHSAITTAPKNLTVNVGSRVQLNCTSDATDYYPSWTINKDGTDENTTVIVSFCRVWDSYTSQYSAVKDGLGVCNLIIDIATLNETGIYTCIDVGLASISSVVTVVDPTETSTSTGQVPTTTSAPSGEACGGNYTADYGVFMSPNYPNAYTLNVECIYRIIPSTMSSITLSFETFELDRSSEDYVLISCESDSGYAPRNFSWYANVPPISIPSCSIGRLYFLSDSSHSYPTRGFRVQYQVSTEGCDNTVFTSSSGIISSPNYPQNYNDGENCTYSIWATEISSFTLTFQAFDLESGSDCQYDWVQIRCDNSSYILQRYCGSTIPKPAHINNCKIVLIWFHTDSSVAFSGFTLQYSVTPNGCGKQRYGGLTGIMTSPNYPGGYDGMECVYYLHPVSSVALDFQSFDLEPFDGLYGDTLVIDCYSNASSAYLAYRGNTLPPLISYEHCSTVRIDFNANYAISGTGYNLRYQANPLVAHTAITTVPKNFTVDYGTRVQMDCTSDAKDYLPSWTLSTDGKDENTASVASFCSVNPYFPGEYITETDGPGVCNLVILFATQAEAGIYTCIDVGLSSIVSVVTVVDAKDSRKATP